MKPYTPPPSPRRVCPSKRAAAIRLLAQEQYRPEPDVSFDAVPRVSEGTSNGAYVQAWVWVSFTGTPLDKEP